MHMKKRPTTAHFLFPKEAKPMSRDARIDALMRLYEHGEISHDELSEQIIIQDEMSDDVRRRKEGIA